MHVLKKLGSGVAVALLPLFLFSFGFLFSLYQVIGSSDGIKGALQESGAYETAVQDTLDAMLKQGEGEEADQLPTQNKEVRAILQQAFSPQFLQTQTEGVLDALYSWLRGEQPNLQFTIDLSDTKTKLVNGLAAYANQRMRELPRCSSPQQANEFEALDILSADCAPPLPRATVVKQVKKEVTKLEFLEDVTLTASDIKNDKGQTLEQQLQGLRDTYGSFRASVYVAGILSLLLIAGVVLLAPHWRTGGRRAAIITATVGAASALLAFGGGLAIQHLSTGIAKDNQGEIVGTFAQALSHLAGDLRAWWLGYGIIAAGLGIATFAALYILKKRQTPPAGSHEEEKPAAKPTAKKQNRIDT